MPFITLCYHFVNNVQSTFSFGSAVDERMRNKLYGLSVELIYLTARLARQWIKERGIIDMYVRAKSGNTSRNTIYNTCYTAMRNNEFAYVCEFTSRRRRVGVGEFARRRVDRIPCLQYWNSTTTLVWNFLTTWFQIRKSRTLKDARAKIF